MMAISRDFDHRPLVFLRFNPDAYLDLLGIKHTSCFIQNKSGIMVLKRQHWVNERMTKLIQQVTY
jgi:hypothetical protein